jgi:hypothetical protein
MSAELIFISMAGPLRNLDLNLLVVFDLVWSERSVSRTARRLRRTADTGKLIAAARPAQFRSISGPFDPGRDLANGQERGDGIGSIADGAIDRIDRFEAQGRMKGHRVRLGIHDHTDATDAVPYLQGKFKHGA